MNSMRSVITRTIVTAAILLPSIGLAGKGTAYINMEEVFQGFHKTARSDAAFKKQKDLYSEHAKSLAAEIEAIKVQRDENQEKALNIGMSEAARQQHRKLAEENNHLYQEKQRDLQEFLQRVDRDLQKQYLDLREEIVKEISTFVKAYAEREVYELVLDVSGLSSNRIPVVVYYPEEKEITQAVLAELNRGHEQADERKPDEQPETKEEE